MAVSVGDLAPEFTLPGVEDGVRREHSLAAYRGRPVVLAFYPGDNTPICTRQLNAYSADLALFTELDAQVLAISPQDLDSHEDFAADQGGFGFPLLADVDKSVAEAYGVLGPLGFYRRSVFVVDEDGRLVLVHRGHAASTFRTSPELAAAVRSGRRRPTTATD
ncbi:MAG: peroxiredoxin [Actinobacteria bacterium]|nr:peroxiredoxin [Actinomycetota bacterium]